ncbi:MAG TPA: 3-deoxy-7-phosphoheptulonate synthase [Spirochaetia bacterium]|mgnify:CR=1 FL=1|nr:3-deoxy-7-phosphoheptulonate synthase [Spirochaetia bacterium]
MILLSKPRSNAERISLAAEFQARGLVIRELPTRQGPLQAVLDFDAALLSSLPDTNGSYTLFEPPVPYVLAGNSLIDLPTTIHIAGQPLFGGDTFTVIAGPCSVESEDQIMSAARSVQGNGAAVLRGGAFKPRSSPYAFQGMGEEGLERLAQAGKAVGLPVITEVLDHDDLDVVSRYADIVQVGARNSQNYALLKRLGRLRKPVLLKRGMMMTIEELLLSAEYIMSGGNMEVILCERGIRTFETGTRNTLDISAVPLLKQKTHLPVVVDPSHAAGSWKLVTPLALAALAVGADGIMVEVHPVPELAKSDGPQSLKPERFHELMERIRLLLPVIGRTLPVPRQTPFPA